jgi:hypothetical protein
MLKNHKKERTKRVWSSCKILCNYKTEERRRGESGQKGDGMKTMREVSGRMQGERSERRKQSETCSADGHSCIYGMTSLRALFHVNLY